MSELKSVQIHIPRTDDRETQTTIGNNTNQYSPLHRYSGEGLNNGTLLSSNQQNCTIIPSGASSVNLVKKVPNKNGGTVSPSTAKKPITLTHLPARPPVTIEFKNLTYSVPERRKKGNRTILKGVDGKFKSGQLSAMVGPSGAGKSTLMNILAGYTTRSRRLSGKVIINEKERNLRRFRKLSCYIMQDDELLPHLTVQEAMMVSANLKLGREINAATKQIIVDEILVTLGLTEAVHTRTANLSGGQRKRLSIALELVNNPPVMFFDEPTSGLDSSSCFQCICLLKALSSGGRTIICTIHQPSARIFEMFDHLYALAVGQCIYQGNVSALVPFLSSMGLECPSYHNPADFLMEVACGEHGDYVHKLVMAVTGGKCNNLNVNRQQTTTDKPITNDIEKQLQDSEGLSNGVSTINTLTVPPTCVTSLLDSDESLNKKSKDKIGFPTSSSMQYYILLKRIFLSIMRDETLTIVRLFSHIIVGLLIGIIYYQIGNDAHENRSNLGCVFVTILFLMFTAMMPTILTFPVEKKVFVREHLNYWYSLKSFYLAKTTADIPFQIVFSIIYASLVYFMTGQPPEAFRFILVLIMCILVSLVSQSIGLLIGAVTKIENGVFFGPVCSVPFVLFSGFFVSFSAIPRYMYWLSYLSYIRYGFEGMMVAIYGFNRERMDCSVAYCHHRYPYQLLEDLDLNHAVYWVDAVALVAIFFVLRLLAYFVLRYKVNSKV